MFFISFLYFCGQIVIIMDFEKLHKKAAKRKNSFVEARIEKPIHDICRNQNKAPIRYLMSGMVAKIEKPSINLYKPISALGGDDAYEGRGYDERIVEPYVLKYQLPCNATTAFLTPSFRKIDRPLAREMFATSRPPEPYYWMMDVIAYVELYPQKAEAVLLEIIRNLIIIKAENEQRLQEQLAKIKAGSEITMLSSEEIVNLIVQHINCKNSSRLPVLVVAAAYASVKDLIGEQAKELLSHQAADRQTGALGDVEITLLTEENTITCYEMKSKAVLKTDIEKSIEKMGKHGSRIDNYIFITTDPIDREVDEFAKSLYREMGTEVVILDCIGFLRHFLHFFHRRRIQFLDNYQELVLKEPTSSVSQALKDAFLALRVAAQE